MNRFLRGSLALHLAGATSLAIWPQRWPWIAGALAADQAALCTAGLWPRCAWLGPNLRELPPGANRVVLTFDDGPDPRVTPRLLDLLDAAGAQASFFVIGRQATRHPELVREIVARGHSVENHSATHPHHFYFLPPARLREEVLGAQQTLAALTGRAPRYFRAPAGIRSPLLQPLLERAGLTLASWSGRGFDAFETDAALVARRLIAKLRDGAILVLHDGGFAAQREAPPVLTVLPPLLEAMRSQGLKGASL